MRHYVRVGRVGALALLWGSSFLWIKIALEGMTPAQVLTARLALGALALTAVLYARGQRLPVGYRTWIHLTVAAVFGNVIPYLLFAIAEQQVDSAVAGILNATTPLWTVLIAYTARTDTAMTRTRLAGLTLGLAGTVLIFSPWHTGTQFTSIGALYCLLAAASYGVSYVYIGRYLAGRSGGDPLSLPAAQLTAATVLSCVFLPVTSGLRPIIWRSDIITATLILGILGTGLAYVLNYLIITADGPVAASVVIYLLPLVAIALGVVALGEEVTFEAVAGMALVLAGVAAARSRRKHLALRVGDERRELVASTPGPDTGVEARPTLER